MRPVVAALAGLLAGCALAESEQGGGGPDAAADWFEVGVVRFADDGETAGLAVPAAGPIAAMVLRATADDGVCFQLSALVDGDGRTPVDERSAGAYCRGCALRTSVAVAAGVFVLPREAGRLDPGQGLDVRFARVDCRTLTPLTGPADAAAVRVEARPVEAVPPRARLDLRFHIADSSILRDDEERQRDLMDHLERALASAGVVPRLVEARALAVPATSVRFHAGDPADLAALLAEVEPRDDATLDVVFAGCLLHDDPFFGPPVAVDGYTPRIPGGAGPADGVFMPGLDCFAEAAGPIDLPADVQARTLAHEIGHYLGLYHVVEADGLVDTLADTDVRNIMNANPGLATSAGFTPSQGLVMRTHPVTRPL